MVRDVPSIIEARHEREFVVYVKFDDATEGFVNLKGELRGRNEDGVEVYAPLREVGTFKSFRVHPDRKSLVWDNGAGFTANFLQNGLHSTPVPWIFVRCLPAFSEDLTSWRTEILRDGRLTQVVEICRFAPAEEDRREEYATRLSPQQVRDLERMIASTDLAKCEYLMVEIDDAEIMHWEIEAGGEIFCMSAPLFALDFHRRRRGLPADPKVASALRLWNAVDMLSPYGSHSEKKA